MTQSIIVYRNPVEQAFWESNLLIPLGGGLLAFVIAVVALGWVVTQLRPYMKTRYCNWLGNAMLVVAAIIGVLAFNYLNI